LPDWHRAFDDPIPLPDGRKLMTLHDVATFITKLPKREHDAPEWQAAIEARRYSEHDVRSTATIAGAASCRSAATRCTR
jgi:hypothetical protein